jgi:Uma2 family endonuclease
MHVIVLEDKGTIPGWVVDHASFRRWAYSAEYPTAGRFGYFRGRLWVDMSRERDSHNQLRMDVLTSIGNRAGDRGRYYTAGMMLTNTAVGFSTEPDGIFAFWDTFRSGRLRLVHGAAADDLEGVPDWVLEVVSPESAWKDNKELPELYWRAGIAEFWRIDPRGPDLRFDLLRYTANGYRAVRARDGWRKSDVFGAAFRLTQAADPLGHPAYALEVES